MASNPTFRTALLVLMGIGLATASSSGSLSAVTHSRQDSVSATSDVQINEVSYQPNTGNFEWVELKNIGAAPANIRGYRLTDEDNNFYRIPDALPDMPPGAFTRWPGEYL